MRNDSVKSRIPPVRKEDAIPMTADLCINGMTEDDEVVHQILNLRRKGICAWCERPRRSLTFTVWHTNGYHAGYLCKRCLLQYQIELAKEVMLNA